VLINFARHTKGIKGGSFDYFFCRNWRLWLLSFLSWLVKFPKAKFRLSGTGALRSEPNYLYLFAISAIVILNEKSHDQIDHEFLFGGF